MTELLAGLSLGLGAGVAPGPLQALVFTAAMQRGFAAGARVALAPLLTDVPIIVLAVVVLAAIPETFLKIVGVIGGGVAIGLGVIEVVRATRGLPDDAAPPARDLWRGVVVNVLSPHPWLFWAVIGGPALVAAWRDAPPRGVAFVGGFYALLVGSKLMLAAVVAAGRTRITDRWRGRLAVAGGLGLIVAGGLLIATSLARP